MTSFFRAANMATLIGLFNDITQPDNAYKARASCTEFDREGAAGITKGNASHTLDRTRASTNQSSNLDVADAVIGLL